MSNRPRDRFLRLLRGLPIITYPDLETAQKRFRLMPQEGNFEPGLLMEIARRSVGPVEGGGYTLKFDRETFVGGDGIETIDLLQRVTVPTLLMRAEHSLIMSVDASRLALEGNPRIAFKEIPDAHHHVILERPAAVAAAIIDYLNQIGAL